MVSISCMVWLKHFYSICITKRIFPPFPFFPGIFFILGLDIPSLLCCMYGFWFSVILVYNLLLFSETFYRSDLPSDSLVNNDHPPSSLSLLLVEKLNQALERGNYQDRISCIRTTDRTVSIVIMTSRERQYNTTL